MILGGLLPAGVLPGVAWLMTAPTSRSVVRVAVASAHGTAWDLQGNAVDPLAHVDGRAVVLIFFGD
jgi:hypothetical protein